MRCTPGSRQKVVPGRCPRITRCGSVVGADDQLRCTCRAGRRRRCSARRPRRRGSPGRPTRARGPLSSRAHRKRAGKDHEQHEDQDRSRPGAGEPRRHGRRPGDREPDADQRPEEDRHLGTLQLGVEHGGDQHRRGDGEADPAQLAVGVPRRVPQSPGRRDHPPVPADPEGPPQQGPERHPSWPSPRGACCAGCAASPRHRRRRPPRRQGSGRTRRRSSTRRSLTCLSSTRVHSSLRPSTVPLRFPGVSAPVRLTTLVMSCCAEYSRPCTPGKGTLTDSRSMSVRVIAMPARRPEHDPRPVRQESQCHRPAGHDPQGGRHGSGWR